MSASEIWQTVVLRLLEELPVRIQAIGETEGPLRAVFAAINEARQADEDEIRRLSLALSRAQEARDAAEVALRTVQTAAKTIVAGSDRRNEAEVQRRVTVGLSTLDSEREANAILTEENERLAALLTQREQAGEQLQQAVLVLSTQLAAAQVELAAVTADRDRLQQDILQLKSKLAFRDFMLEAGARQEEP